MELLINYFTLSDLSIICNEFNLFLIFSPSKSFFCFPGATVVKKK